MAIFALIGILASHKSKASSEDYLLASNTIPASISALSMMSSKFSGYMFIGFIGFVYLKGFSGILLAAGLVAGDFIGLHLFSNKIKQLHNKYKSLSYEDLISQRASGVYKKLRFVLASLILILLSIYISAQLKASSKAIHGILDWPENSGIFICAAFVLFYSWSGGIRASMWTDAIQSILMIVSAIALGIYSIVHLGGIHNFFIQANSISESYFSIFKSNISIGGVEGILIFSIGWLFGGFAILGQPHAMIRILALNNIKNLKSMKKYYYLSSLILLIALFIVGISCRLILKQNGLDGFDPEMALPLLSLQLMPSIFVGIILAGIFAAVMSTVDSQILSCSAAVSQSLTKNKTSYFFNKVVTVVLIILTSLMALFATGSVFDLVVFAYAILGVTLGTAIIIQVIFPKMKESICLAIVILSGMSSVVWVLAGYKSIATESLIGFVVSFTLMIFYKIFCLFKKTK
ncbi:MAG: hypothetical protein HAW60_01175 [Bdellovibrionales bacterium]|nr:hypothetical protein [Bdellovibrionales bacterium]